MPRKRGMTETGNRRRAEIIAQAERFLEEGRFEEMTMESIAEALDVGKSSLYHYFKQKEDILFAIHAETLADQVAQLDDVIALGVTATEKLRLAVKQSVTLLADHPGRVRVLWDAPSRKLLNIDTDAMEAAESEFRTRWAKIIQDGMDAGEFVPGQAYVLANIMIGMVAHIRYWFEPTPIFTHENIAHQLWATAINGLTGSSVTEPSRAGKGTTSRKAIKAAKVAR